MLHHGGTAFPNPSGFALNNSSLPMNQGDEIKSECGMETPSKSSDKENSKANTLKENW